MLKRNRIGLAIAGVLAANCNILLAQSSEAAKPAAVLEEIVVVGSQILGRTLKAPCRLLSSTPKISR